MQPDFQKFLNDCKSNYTNDYFPNFCNETEQKQSDFEKKNISEDAYVLLGKLIGLNQGFSVKFANDLILKHLETYHNWLLENYDVKPKNQ